MGKWRVIRMNITQHPIEHRAVTQIPRKRSAFPHYPNSLFLNYWVQTTLFFTMEQFDPEGG